MTGRDREEDRLLHQCTCRDEVNIVAWPINYSGNGNRTNSPTDLVDDGGIYCLYRYYGVFAAAAVANDNNVIRLHFEIISVQSGSGCRAVEQDGGGGGVQLTIFGNKMQLLLF